MQIKLREIQHFLYCPHRWGLIEINQAWAENYFVVKGNMLHERVHDPDKAYSLRGKKVLTGLDVYLDAPEYELYGVVDCLELSPSSAGVVMPDGKRYNLCIVEYKPSMPKGQPFREDDAMQVFAQKLCVDNIFSCRSNAVIYYGKEKRRVDLPFQDEYDKYVEELKRTLLQISDYKMRGIIPPKSVKQNCSGCSMKDLCMPLKGHTQPLRQRIQSSLAEEWL